MRICTEPPQNRKKISGMWRKPKEKENGLKLELSSLTEEWTTRFTLINLSNLRISWQGAFDGTYICIATINQKPIGWEIPSGELTWPKKSPIFNRRCLNSWRRNIEETWDSLTMPLRCPHVTAWQAGWRGFQTFSNFFERRLQGGQVHCFVILFLAVIFQVSEVWKRGGSNWPGAWKCLLGDITVKKWINWKLPFSLYGWFMVYVSFWSKPWTTTKLQIQLVPNSTMIFLNAAAFL